MRLYLNGQLLIDNWTDHARGAEQRDRRARPPARGTTSGWTTTSAATLATARLSWAYPGPEHPGRAAVGAVSGAAGQSAARRQRGRRPDDHSARRRVAERDRPRRRAAEPGDLTTTWSKISGREDSDGGTVVFANPNAPVDDGDVRRRRHLRAAADGERRRGDGQRRRDDHGQSRRRSIGTGTGLVGEYFSDPNNGSHFVTLVFGRLDTTRQLRLGVGSPGVGRVGRQLLGALDWQGAGAGHAASYTFTTMADDGVRLWVNGQLVIDNWVDQGVTTRSSAPVALVAGALYDIKMEYYEHGGLATAQAAVVLSGAGAGRDSASRNSIRRRTGRRSVNAGADRTITLPGDDDAGRAPRPTTACRRRRRAVEHGAEGERSGHGDVRQSHRARTPTATFSAAGTYVLRLSVSDGALTSTDDVTVVVNAARRMA